MNKIEPDSSAFPVIASFLERQRSGESHRFTNDVKSDPGMTKREYIALHMMQGILSACHNPTRYEIEKAADTAVRATESLIWRLSK